ncbi:sugar O-acetyltransferase [uncultured Dubosiella sp.]|jgi:galactoside O-acetyltransferase|uniref:sugar O-acetyltransferase n=2 Tax=uncultured Dubosiella sp. TaxID=1937011 RepID=UPI00208B0851|nr:sugar O-acetyltransferase [uncultured Dubosiella sp.]GJM58450.1 galactoside O-acetyltransferase [Erysipelotrichaceae bacterium OPF54]
MKKEKEENKMSVVDDMLSGKLYDPGTPELKAMQKECMRRLEVFNSYGADDKEKKKKFMAEQFACCGEGCHIELPFRANWGGKFLSLGDRVYINFNWTIVDDGPITIGNDVQIGPNVTMTTANHPIDPELRKKGLQTNHAIVIEDNVWIGANVVVLPGVRIGKNSVIGAGSVVTKDVPPNVVAFGNPCRVQRSVDE